MSHPAGECPVCNKKFHDGDDVVICPSCGAPYHRECYQKEGHCLFEHKHGTGFEYAAPQKPGEEQKAEPNAAAQDGGAAQADGGILCGSCGTVNDAQNIFCERCGSPLHNKGPAGAQQAGGTGGGFSPFGGQGAAYGGPQINMSGKLDDIDKADWADYIGDSAPTYLYRMSQMQRRGSKVSFMISAFFFSPYYFAYRKMWGWAAIAMVASLLFTSVEMFAIAAAAGNNLLPWLSTSLLETISTISYVMHLGMQFGFGFFALQLFRGSAGKKIKALRAAHSSDVEYHEAVVKKGGVSIPAVVVAVAVLFAFSWAFSYYVGEDLVNYLYAMF